MALSGIAICRFSAGAHSSCFVTKSKGLVFQTGRSSSTSTVPRLCPTFAKENVQVIEISTGHEHNLALTKDGCRLDHQRIYHWGKNWNSSTGTVDSVVSASASRVEPWARPEIISTRKILVHHQIDAGMIYSMVLSSSVQDPVSDTEHINPKNPRPGRSLERKNSNKGGV